MMRFLQPKLNKFYSQIIKPGSLVYDIGSNDGDYAETFLTLGAHVICVEPQPEYIKKLQKKFGINKKVTLVQQGIGEKAGTLDFHISSFNSPNSTFSTEFREHSRYKYRTWDKVIKVEVITLNQLIQQFGLPHFCKVDVEGYEWEVLSTLKKPIPFISFEFMTELNEKSFKIIKHLDTLGKARYNLCLGMSYRYHLPEWVDSKTMVSLLEEKQEKAWNGDIYVKFIE